MGTNRISYYTLRIMLIVSLLVLVICGCGLSPIVWFVADGTRDYNTERETIFIKNPSPDILQTAAAVGESMGYRLNTKIPYPNMMIQLVSEIGTMAFLVTGHEKDNSIEVCRTPDGLKIEVTTSGTFGAGSRENAKKILGEYKEKLMNKVALR